jgi:uroporphyrinogen-III synthase
MGIARDMGLEDAVYAALRGGVAVASVGPVMTETLESHGIAVDITPKHPKMASLVKSAADESAEVLQRKRIVRIK